jgi:hypothetical protein
MPGHGYFGDVEVAVRQRHENAHHNSLTAVDVHICRDPRGHADERMLSLKNRLVQGDGAVAYRGQAGG